MHKQLINVRWTRFVIAVIFIISTLISSATLFLQQTKAANFSMQTGYYVGSGTANKIISGVGFQPDLIIIKSKNGTSAATSETVFRSTGMVSANTGYLSANADSTTTAITPNSDGFSLGTLNAVNAANVVYAWTAFSGSDCSATGNFCVGTYNGTGTTRNITTGFQPGLVIVKRSNGTAGHFRTASMPANQTSFFGNAADDTTGSYLGAVSSTGFSVGVTDNTTSGVYYYIAFKSTAGVFTEGSYTGDATDNRNITGLGFNPNLVMVKNATSATAANRDTVFSSREYNGDASNYAGSTTAAYIDIQDAIQKMDSDGFQVGTSALVNETGTTMYWFAFGGAPAISGASGTFTMATGSYTGTGVAQSIASVPFAPDLVIIKDNSTSFTVFRTSLMAGNVSAYLANPVADAANLITSMDANGFTVGTSTTVNASARTYQWQAFGNAYRPDTKKGAADFAIGTYSPTSTADTSILGAPYQLDFVTIKQAGALAGVFRTSDQVGDTSGYFSASAEVAGGVKAFNSTGFQLGANASVNTTGSYRWFGFKTGSNFTVGSYTGTGVVDRAVTIGSGIKPDLIWIKAAGSSQPAARTNTLTGDTSQYFSATANTTNIIKSITTTGVTLGTSTTVNTNAAIYRYIVWKVPSGVLSGDIVSATGASVVSPNITMNSSGYPFGCDEVTGSLGTTSQRIRVSNLSTSPAWSTSIAATDGATALWRNSGNTQQYDYNESSGSTVGCADGGDGDSVAGKLRIEPSTGTIAPKAGCSTANVSLGSNQNFSESTTDAITLMTASTSAATGCYWDLTGVSLRQYIPAGQPAGSYNLNLTVTTIAS